MTEQLPIVEAFIHYLLDERHFSPYTARCYGVDLRQFAEGLADAHSITTSRDQERDAFEQQKGRPAPGEEPDVVAAIGPPTITGTMLRAARCSGPTCRRSGAS